MLRMLHLPHVDLIVLRVRPDKTHIDDPVGIVDLHHKSVIVAFNVEYNAILPHETGAPILRLDLCRVCPIRLFRLAIPRQQRFFGVRMTLSEGAQRALREASMDEIIVQSQIYCKYNNMFWE